MSKIGKICLVVGTRPNFMKIAPIINRMKILGIDFILVHTGQHYDNTMSKDIMNDLNLDKPDYFLDVRGGSHAVQTSRIMKRFEKVCIEIKPSLVVVPGDVNSTLACALVAAKMNIPLAHIESGLRSFDKNMPEEKNRILVDHISDLLFVSEISGIDNLKKEGISGDMVHLVGNCMIDSLISILPKSKEKKPWENFNLCEKEYTLVTLHRPSNVDKNIEKTIDLLNLLSKENKLLFPVHPRTMKQINKYKKQLNNNIVLCDPLSYIDFLGIMSEANIVVTDSGGIQEETTYLGVQCVTFRDNTERPITVDIGTNHLVGTNIEDLIKTFKKITSGDRKNGKIPEKWDGKTADRIIDVIINL